MRGRRLRRVTWAMGGGEGRRRRWSALLGGRVAPTESALMRELRWCMGLGLRIRLGLRLRLILRLRLGLMLRLRVEMRLGLRLRVRLRVGLGLMLKLSCLSSLSVGLVRL